MNNFMVETPLLLGRKGLKKMQGVSEEVCELRDFEKEVREILKRIYELSIKEEEIREEEQQGIRRRGRRRRRKQEEDEE